MCLMAKVHFLGQKWLDALYFSSEGEILIFRFFAKCFSNTEENGKQPIIDSVQVRPWAKH